MNSNSDKTKVKRPVDRDQSVEPDEPEDQVDEASEESFPASDPPAWTAAIAH